ncbi:MAG: hypothetical protein KBE65_15925 [Phycisphaerae bacterium]|nr:hypothetical protein [Phycisphaerae bacterium]
MAKRSKETVWERRARVLAHAISNGPVPLKTVQSMTRCSKATVESDIRELQSIGIPVASSGGKVVLPPLALESLWEGTDVGFRLRSTPSMMVKRRLGEATVDYLRDHNDPIKSIVFGSGVSAYETAECLFLRRHELHIEVVFTSSILVLLGFVYCDPKSMILNLVGSQFDRATAWLQGESKQLGDQSVDAVVVSFMHLSKEGFWTRQPYEVEEKVAHLKGIKSPLILIPIEWSKWADKYGNLVAPRGGSGEDAFDFKSGRKYVIISDIPDKPHDAKDKDRLAVLDFWRSKPGVEIVKVPCTE